VRHTIIAVVILLATVSSANAQTRHSLTSSPRLWATVDACRSSASGDVVGLRGSMPGGGNDSEQMFMSFELQYRNAQERWQTIPGGTALVSVGSARYASRQAGRDFNLASSTAAGTVLRGVVSFEWRRGHVIVRRVRRATTAGRAPSAGASPPGYSAARCSIS